MEHRQNENHAGYAENIGLDAYFSEENVSAVPHMEHRQRCHFLLVFIGKKII